MHNDYTTVIQPDQMCRTPPNQVADHTVISIAYPRIRCRYGGAHPTNKLVRISHGQRLPIWFPVEAIEFYTRQFKRGSDARGHRCLASTRGPDYHDSHLPLARSCKRGYPIARQRLNVCCWPYSDGRVSASCRRFIGSSGPDGGRCVKMSLCHQNPYPKILLHDLKKWSKDRPEPERSDATRGELNAPVSGPFWRMSPLAASGTGGATLPGTLGPERVCWSRRVHRVQQTLVCA
jgi:hypothetical protein